MPFPKAESYRRRQIGGKGKPFTYGYILDYMNWVLLNYYDTLIILYGKGIENRRRRDRGKPMSIKGISGGR